ncbi:MAG: riboflavin biosynthesis protein RibF [Bacteroidaceae bacterium]|nr:riboflavin biosynthesis protein RibF [Bacteroidales bacterium]MEA4968424.1 riboflavin biosynthesis protein RibF [Bacteroidaceae bacterium]NCC18753.1 riboflavin biosynthesis protein RibF [Bacteroidia bacterium]
MNIIPFEKEFEQRNRPVITIGMFDGVHIGHQSLISDLKEKAKELNTNPIIITFDNHPQLALKPKNLSKISLLQTNEERFSKLQTLGINDIITIHFTKEFAQIKAEEFIDLLLKKYNPQYLLSGYDNHFGNKSSQDFDILVIASKEKGLILERSKNCVFYDDIEVSSTQIRKALANGNIKLANAMLNEDYLISGEVEHGNKIGTKIGYPTANIKIDRHKLLPLYGVYITEVEVDEKKYQGVVSIGVRPTINKDIALEEIAPSVEVNIFEFYGDLYGKKIKLRLKDFIREEIKFDDLDSLKAKINEDVKKAKLYFKTNE